MTESFEQVWRRESPYVLAALLRRHPDLADCEDAAQEAAAAASTQWAIDGRPHNPRGWLIRVASRRLIDQVRSEQARAAREQAEAVPEFIDVVGHDDTLELLLLCCHPRLSRPTQVALTLRSVGGLTTAQIAAAYLIPERTMAQRLSRARATLRAAGARFELPPEPELPERVAAALDVCHLMFNEGYTRSAGVGLLDVALADEAIRITRQLRQLLPDHDEVAGALALMLLTHARADARTDAAGDLIPLANQDRARWDRTSIDEGVALLHETLPRGHVGRYQLQAAIAAVHADAPTWPETDWLQINLLYAMLDNLAPSPAVTLNRAVAVAMTFGPQRGLDLLSPLLDHPVMSRHHRTHAVRAHLLELLGDRSAAAESYLRAARLTTSQPEQRYLNAQRTRLIDPRERTD
jgi:RNA polymerase sigma factor (sigma-70 family)